MKPPVVTPIKKIKLNPENPRVIKDDKFQQLVKSIQEFPKMLHLRPIVVNKSMMILGGNQRLKACIEAGLKEVPILIADELTKEEQSRFIIQDNVGFGEWDTASLTDKWDLSKLNDWGLYVPEISDVDINSFFEDSKNTTEPKSKIVLEYTQEDYDKVIEAFKEHDGTKEDTVARLLGV